MVDQVKNFIKVTVNTGYDALATSIVLSSGEGTELPDPSGDNYNLVWWDSTNYPDPSDDPNVEIIRVTTKSSDTLTITRNQEVSGASTKNTSGATYKMILGPTSKTITDLQSEIDSDITIHAGLSDVHHIESHTVVSHSDTTATGAELETLTDGSDADSLHAHTVNDAKVTNATHTGDVTGATALTIGADKVLDSHINWGTGATQVSAVDLLIADVGVIITATEVEGALQENRTAIDLNTAKNTNVSTTLSVGTVGASTVAITSDGGADDVTLPASTNAAAGMATAFQITKLEGIATGADVTGDNAPQTHAMSTHTDEGALATLSTVDTAQINVDAVTYDKIQDVSATNKLLGRSTAGAGTVEEIACTAAGRAILDDANTTAQRTTLDVDQAGTDNSTDVTLNASATTGGLSLIGQDVSHRAATNAQTGYMTAALVTNIETNNGKVTNATHTGDVTGDVALTIAAGAVDIAMLANGTDGELITWDADGAPDTVAIGTAAHVLTSNGVGVPPTFQAAIAGSQTVNVYLPAESAYLPATNPAGLAETAGATVYGGYSFLAFDDSTDEHAIWRTPMPDYDGGNIIVKFYWYSSDISGTVAWNIESIGVTDGEEILAAVVTDAAEVTADEVTGTTLDLNITTHSTYNPASVASDDIMVIEITRDISRDDMSADANLFGILLEYTRV